MLRDGLVGIVLLAALGLSAAGAWRFLAAPPGSVEAADLLVRIDQDGDGRIGAAEYDRVSDGELPFSVADADGSGQIEPWEVDILIRYVSPLRASMSWVPRAL